MLNLKYAGLFLGLVLMAPTPQVKAQTNATTDPPAPQVVQPIDPQPTPSSQPQSPPQSPPQLIDSELLIGSGDLLEVSVFGAPDFAKQTRVSSEGNISLPLIGNVQVAGLSIAAAERTIAKLLRDGGFFSDPQVSIFEKEYTTQGISVLGEVLKPGIYPLLGQRTLFDALSAAGGTTPRAGNTATITHRNSPGKPQTVRLTSGPGGPQPRNNVPILPGDTIVVSKAGIVYVIGNVAKPGGFVMENAEMTVLQAIALAQGISPHAALDRARLIRRDVEHQPQEIPIQLKQILAAKAPDLHLQADDIVFVPNSAGKAAFTKSVELILQTASGIAIYGPR